jgi:hypothetical protein
MSAQQLAEEIETLIMSGIDVFADETIRLQDLVYNRLVNSLRGLELDADGFILQNNANRKILYEAGGVVDDLLPGQSLTKTVSDVLALIPQIEALNAEYFGGISSSFKLNRSFLSLLQSQTIEKIEGTLLQDGLRFSINGPLKDILNQNINTGGQFSGMLEQVRNFIKGDETLDGRLLSYSRGILRDTLFDYSRAFQNAVTADLKLEYFMYAGGVMDKTRPFCLERYGRYFHESEIKKWADQEWEGKRRGTTESSIFVFCGGYNCAHSMIPVHKSIVPKSELVNQ